MNSEQRFGQTPDGNIWTPSGFPYSYWRRYLDGVFDSVLVIARVRGMRVLTPDWKQANGPCVRFAALPHYVGPLEYLLRRNQIHARIRESIGTHDAIILRIASQIASCIERAIRRDRPIAVEVVSDPWNTFAPGSVNHALRPYFRWHFTRETKRLCRRACAAGYVTERYLQERYPAARSAFQTAYAATELDDNAVVPTPRTYLRDLGPIRLITVGSLAQMYKGVDVLITAVAKCVLNGLDIHLVVVGEGRHRSDLEHLARQLGCANRVTFTGALPSGQAVRDQLDAADLFVLVSRTEGLPGALIEAMARGLPCIGTAVAGIPELLSSDQLVRPNDAEGLASRIAQIISDPDRMNAMAKNNLVRAQCFRESVLSSRRHDLLMYLRCATDDWMNRTCARTRRKHFRKHGAGPE